MHEMGLACSVLDAVRIEADRVPGSRPSRVGLRVGEWSGVDVESLRFCLETLAPDSDMPGLAVVIEFQPQRDVLDIAFVELEE